MYPYCFFLNQTMTILPHIQVLVTALAPLTVGEFSCNSAPTLSQSSPKSSGPKISSTVQNCRLLSNGRPFRYQMGDLSITKWTAPFRIQRELSIVKWPFICQATGIFLSTPQHLPFIFRDNLAFLFAPSKPL